MSRHYDTVVSAIEAVKRDAQVRRAPISKPLTKDDGDYTFAGMQEFDLGPTEVFRDGRFKMKTGKWG